ncbi:MAG TPA: CAP domain-containing protein [Polyangiaceae bacterium]|nr:CAP domain-containing protein [Polyangiaceae bacterium]
MTRRQLNSLWGVALASASLVACSGSTPSGPSDLGSTTGASTGGDGTGSASGSFGPGTSGGTRSTGSTGASGSIGGSASGTSTGSGGSGTGTHADAGADSSTTGRTDAGKTITGDSGGIVGADGGACPAPSGITSQQTTALQIINQTRAAMGSPCATIVSALNTSATKHCQYYAANVSNMTCISNPHVEVSSCTDYVAAQFYDRETAAGYMCQPSLTQMCGSFEVMAFDDNPTYALAQWIGSIYHRTPVLDPRTRDFGYGGAMGCDTIDFGEGAGSTTASNVIVSYPYDGQTGVGTSFNGAQEEPTPPVPPNGWPSAMPITIFMEATSVTLTTDEFGVDGGAQLAHQVMTPQSNQLVQNALVLYGNAPLMSKTKYRVHVAGTRSTQSFSGSTSSAMFDVSFAFTTM